MEQKASKVRVITHTVCTYETTDGREFDSKDEAIDWQTALDSIDDIVMLNSRRLPTNQVDEAYYVWIKTDEQVKVYNEVQDYYGLHSSIEEPGFYTYDDNCDAYVNLEEEIQKLQEHIDLLKEEDKKC